MATKNGKIAGYEVNLETSRDGSTIRSATVLVGPADKPGWRAKDGPAAKARRRNAKRAIMSALGLPAKQVRVVARYSALVPLPGGNVGRRDASGQIVGVYQS